MEYNIKDFFNFSFKIILCFLIYFSSSKARSSYTLIEEQGPKSELMHIHSSDLNILNLFSYFLFSSVEHKHTENDGEEPTQSGPHSHHLTNSVAAIDFLPTKSVDFIHIESSSVFLSDYPALICGDYKFQVFRPPILKAS